MSRIVYGTSYNLHASHYVTALPTNYVVFFCGATSGLQKGKVTHYSYSYDQGTEWMLADYECDYGDSGGVVFSIVNGDYCIIGVHAGELLGYGCSTKFSTILDYCPVTLY